MYIIQKIFCADDISCDTSNSKCIFGTDNDNTKDKSNLRIKSQQETHKLFKAVYLILLNRIRWYLSCSSVIKKQS